MSMLQAAISAATADTLNVNKLSKKAEIKKEGISNLFLFYLSIESKISCNSREVPNRVTNLIKPADIVLGFDARRIFRLHLTFEQV